LASLRLRATRAALLLIPRSRSLRWYGAHWVAVAGPDQPLAASPPRLPGVLDPTRNSPA
jgi:hypothetical protein